MFYLHYDHNVQRYSLIFCLLCKIETLHYNDLLVKILTKSLNPLA